MTPTALDNGQRSPRKLAGARFPTGEGFVVVDVPARAYVPLTLPFPALGQHVFGV